MAVEFNPDSCSVETEWSWDLRSLYMLSLIRFLILKERYHRDAGCHEHMIKSQWLQSTQQWKESLLCLTSNTVSNEKKSSEFHNDDKVSNHLTKTKNNKYFIRNVILTWSRLKFHKKCSAVLPLWIWFINEL